MSDGGNMKHAMHINGLAYDIWQGALSKIRNHSAIIAGLAPAFSRSTARTDIVINLLVGALLVISVRIKPGRISCAVASC